MPCYASASSTNMKEERKEGKAAKAAWNATLNKRSNSAKGEKYSERFCFNLIKRLNDR